MVWLKVQQNSGIHDEWDDHDEWDTYIPLLTAAYRSTVHPATGYTSNFLMFGREVNMLVDLMFPLPISELNDSDVAEYMSKLRQRLELCYDHAWQCLKHAAVRQKKD